MQCKGKFISDILSTDIYIGWRDNWLSVVKTVEGSLLSNEKQSLDTCWSTVGYYKKSLLREHGATHTPAFMMKSKYIV